MTRMIKDKLLPYCLCLALLLALMAPCLALAQEESPNLLENSGFEALDGNGLPVGWYTEAYVVQAGFTDYGLSSPAKEGQTAVFVENFGPNDARFAQDVSVEPNTVYCLTGYVRTENVPDAGIGANLSVEGVYVFSDGVYGDAGWQKLTLYGQTGPDQDTVTVFARLGGYGGESEGKAYFDELSLTKVTGEIPAGALLTLWYPTSSPAAEDPDESGEFGGASNWPSLAVLALAFLALMACLLRPLQRETPAERLTQESKDNVKILLSLALFAAFVIRVILAMKIPGMEHDVNDFRAWGNMMGQYGPADIYTSAGLLDYPPALLYVWWLNSAIESWLAPLPQGLILLNIKFAPILADMVTAVMIYRLGKKRMPMMAAAVLSLLCAFNPVVLLNGAAWGQVDSILALGLLLVCAFALERKWERVLPIYVLCVLMKPQALMLGPLGLVAIVQDVVRAVSRKEGEKPLKDLGYGLLWSVAVAVAILLPFTVRQPVTWIFGLYGNTLSSYPYTTLNTTNFYYFPASYNWGYLTDQVGAAILVTLALIMAALAAWRFMAAQRRKGDVLDRYVQPAFLLAGGLMFAVMAFLHVNFSAFGTGMMALVVLWVLLTYLRGRRLENLPLMGAILFIGLYVFGVMMHERYLFPAIILLFLAYIQKRDWRILVLLAGFTATTFINSGIVLDNSIRLGFQNLHLNEETRGICVLLSILNMALTAFAVYTGERLCAMNAEAQRVKLPDAAPANSAPAQVQPAETRAGSALLHPKDARFNLTRLDALLLAGVTAAYAVLTFWNLGSMKAPQTAFISSKAGEQVVLDLGAQKDFRVLYYGGINYNDFSVAVSGDGQVWSEEYSARMQEGNCFQWQYLVETYQGDAGSVSYTEAARELSGRYVRVTAPVIGLNLSEIILRTADQQVLPVTIFAHTGNNPNNKAAQPAENLIDEQDSLEGEPSWFNGTYFDEIYHARTAYEHAHGLSTYETSHPPLGKVMMSWAVMAFGMTPFGWRFAGAFVGVLMLPVLYLLGKQLTRRTDLAAAAMLLLAFDLMHFTQTRIATIDSFPVLFIMLSYLCMYRYMMMDFWGTPFYKTLIPLALSGLFMGLGIASKWIGLYAGAGLAVLFFYSCWRHFMESREAAKLMRDHKKSIPRERQEAVELAAQKGLARILTTLPWCVLFFIAVPAVIYYLSYIPYFAYSGGVTLQKIIDAQRGMYNYHSTPGLGDDHPFKSPWWEWPLILKPMGYNTRGVRAPAGMAYTIYAMGNPAVWWTGLAALLIVTAVWAKRHVWADGRGRLLHLHTKAHDMVPALILLGFLSQYLPWVLVPRSTFIYHYFASVPFIILCTVLCFLWLGGVWKKGYKPLLWALVALAAILFVGFYPYASGVTVSTKWLDFMKWFPRIYY